MRRSIASRRMRSTVELQQMEGHRDPDNGEWVEGEPTRSMIEVVATPPGAGRESDLTTAGQRIEGERQYLVRGSRVSPDTTSATADQIVEEGRHYSVISVAQWPGFQLVRAVLLDPQPQPEE